MYDVFIMDMGGHDANVQHLLTRFPHAQVVRYYDSHLNTLKRCVARARTEFIWVVSSCCDYSNFDFNYKSVPWEAYQIHCWASNSQKFGDTFLIPVDEFKKQQPELLEWYRDVNWHDALIKRQNWPICLYNDANLISQLQQHNFTSVMTWFIPENLHEIELNEDVCLWTEKQRQITTFSKGNSIVLAPRDVKKHIKTQAYDYPSIVKYDKHKEEELDIVFITNGEPNINQWHQHLARTSGRKIIWVDGVVGRMNAYKAAAALSSTPWFFAVFAKQEVSPDFNWAWQPDYLQQPKHYIFYSKNPVNGLEYGHMGIIAYNKELVLTTNEHGLDFTLSKPHAVVPVVSAVAHYNTTPELTWRTAFREAIKLQDDIYKTKSVESKYRLKVWLTKAEGDYAEWSIKGAEDAVEYYHLVSGNFEELLLSFEWKWLTDYYTKKYSC